VAAWYVNALGAFYLLFFIFAPREVNLYRRSAPDFTIDPDVPARLPDEAISASALCNRFTTYCKL